MIDGSAGPVFIARQGYNPPWGLGGLVLYLHLCLTTFRLDNYITMWYTYTMKQEWKISTESIETKINRAINYVHSHDKNLLNIRIRNFRKKYKKWWQFWI
jgi:hypothetical protein